MKGRTPNASEKRYLEAVRSLGCIVCWTHHYDYRPAAIHHIDGKTKPGAHYNVLPLCYEHHQGAESEGPFISRHPWKRRFEQCYGTEDELRTKVQEMLGTSARESA